MIRVSHVVAVTDSSAVAQARRVALQQAEACGLGEVAAGKAALVATELATNQLKHAPGGSMLFGSSIEMPEVITIIAIDRGQGIPNVNRAFGDGYSTAGSAGTGLGAISRAATTMDVYTQEGKGTAILAAVANSQAPRPAAGVLVDSIAIGGVCVPKPGEDEPGDAWGAVATADHATITIADGLGHGPLAAVASEQAIRTFRENARLPLERLFDEMHGALRPTRGAAVGIARLEAGAGRVDFAGIGNIAATVIEGDSVRKMVSWGGIVGHHMTKAKVFSYPWTEHSTLLMHSDGIATSWNLDHYPGLLSHRPALIAAVIYRDYFRGNDDATIVVTARSRK